MKRGMSGRTRRGAPPLRQQRRALRVVQLTLVAMSAWFGWMASRAWEAYSNPPALKARALGASVPTPLGEVIALAFATLLFLGLAAMMGVRSVRGPEPPQI